MLEVPLAAGANELDLKRIGGGLLVQTPDVRNVDATELQVVTKLQPTPRAARRSAVRLARGQVREVQRHRFLRERHDAGRGRRPDEPRRFRPHRLDQGAECRA